MDKPEIKDWYEHEHSPSIFVMFMKEHEIVWSYSGNQLRIMFLKEPDEYVSGPIELPIPSYLDKELTDAIEN